MLHCSYCSQEAGSVIEVRYARTLGKGSDNERKEIVGRGYGVCDGCMKLLDYKLEHHVPPQHISAFNLDEVQDWNYPYKTDGAGLPARGLASPRALRTPTKSVGSLFFNSCWNAETAARPGRSKTSPGTGL